MCHLDKLQSLGVVALVVFLTNISSQQFSRVYTLYRKHYKWQFYLIINVLTFRDVFPCYCQLANGIIDHFDEAKQRYLRKKLAQFKALSSVILEPGEYSNLTNHREVFGDDIDVAKILEMLNTKVTIDDLIFYMILQWIFCCRSGCWLHSTLRRQLHKLERSVRCWQMHNSCQSLDGIIDWHNCHFRVQPQQKRAIDVDLSYAFHAKYIFP